MNGALGIVDVIFYIVLKLTYNLKQCEVVSFLKDDGTYTYHFRVTMPASLHGSLISPHFKRIHKCVSPMKFNMILKLVKYHDRVI